MKTSQRGDTMISVLIGVILLSVVIVASVQGSAGIQLISANMRQLLQGGMVSLDVAELLKARAQTIAASDDDSSAKLAQVNGFVNALTPKLNLLANDGSGTSGYSIHVSQAQLVDTDFAQLTLDVSWNSMTGQQDAAEKQTLKFPLAAINSGESTSNSRVSMLGWSDLSDINSNTTHAPNYSQGYVPSTQPVQAAPPAQAEVRPPPVQLPTAPATPIPTPSGSPQQVMQQWMNYINSGGAAAARP